MDRPFGRHFATRSVVAGRRGLVAASQPLAAQIGLDVLKRGGSAVDAAIATNAALGLMEPTGCGIGGDLFAIIRAQGEIAGLNGSGRSPRSLTLARLLDLADGRIPSHGPLSVSVPGAVDGWFELHRRFGRLPMREVLAPAIDYARNGFAVSEIIAAHWQISVARLSAYPGVTDVYAPGGRAPAAGDTFANPLLAEAYELLSTHGRDAFYRGPIAAAIDRQMREQGGHLSAGDLAAHRSEWVAPIATDYRGHTVWQLPPNTQGLAVLQMLNVLEGFDIGRLERDSPEYLHLLIEAKRLAFEDRARYYADPSFSSLPVGALASKHYAAERRGLIDPERAMTGISHGDASALSRGDTVYLAAADRDGMLVSLIQSNFRGMGSGVVVPGYGFMLQNRGELFSVDPAHPNVYAPGKRPFNTIIPGLMTRADELAMAFGVMGADMQPQGQVQVLQGMIDFGMNVQEAGDAPRLRHDGSRDPTGAGDGGVGRVCLESGFSRATIEGLAALGHRIEPDDGYGFGGYQAILHDRARGVYLGASESRKDGHAVAC
jgi:gamma-glutamyltranspeptidase / glutathione hydrolase